MSLQNSFANGSAEEKILVEKLLELKDIYKKKKTFTDEDVPVSLIRTLLIRL